MFDEFKNYKFIGFKQVKIKNKPSSKDYNKVTNILPGIPQGYCKDFFDIVKTKQTIEAKHFYDVRQGGKSLNKLKGYFIRVID